MCFWQSKSDSKLMAIPPPPAPSPTPTFSDPNPQATAEQKRSKIAALKYGMMSTMKTGGRGVTGKGSDLAIPAAEGKKTTLGA